MSSTGSYPREELINIGLVVAAGLVFAVGSVAVRASVPAVPLVYNLLDTEYTVAFLLLGMLPLLWIVSVKDQTKVATAFLGIALTGVIAFPPGPTPLADIAGNLMFAGAVALMGIAYFRLNDSVSRFPVLLIVAVLLLNFYLYGTYYLIVVFTMMGDLRLLLGVGVLTLMLIGLARILYAEYGKLDSGGFSF